MTPQEFKQIRITLGLNQTQLGLKLNVEANHISKIENGKKGITEKNEEKMRTLLWQHRLRRRLGADEYVPQPRPKIRIPFPYYSYQRRTHADD